MQKLLKIVILTTLLSILFYFCVGIFVIQPIGAAPNGATILYWRFGLSTSFISSADGILLQTEAGVSLLGRVIILGAMAKVLEDRKIVTLPYSQTVYLISTGGWKFEE